jgi:hypothetical protein
MIRGVQKLLHLPFFAEYICNFLSVGKKPKPFLQQHGKNDRVKVPLLHRENLSHDTVLKFLANRVVNSNAEHVDVSQGSLSLRPSDEEDDARTAGGGVSEVLLPQCDG